MRACDAFHVTEEEVQVEARTIHGSWLTRTAPSAPARPGVRGNSWYPRASCVAVCAHACHALAMSSVRPDTGTEVHEQVDICGRKHP